MLLQKKIIGILIFTSVSFFLFGKNCEDTFGVKQKVGAGKTLELLQLAEQLENCENLKDSLAQVFHKLSLISNSNGNLDSAILFTEKALKIRQELFGEKPNLDLGKSYYNLGVFYLSKERTDEAKKMFKTATQIFPSVDSSRMLNSYLELGFIELQSGEFEVAKDIFNLVIIEAEKTKEDVIYARGLLNLGLLFYEKQQPKEAIEYLEKAEPILFEKGDYEDEAACYNNLGINYFLLKNYPKAIEYYQKANSIFKTLKNCREISKSFNNLGLVYQKSNEEQKTIDALSQGLKTAQTCESIEMIGHSYDILGVFYLEKNEPQKALSYFQKSIQTLLPKFESKEDWNNPTELDVQFAFNKIDLLIYFSDKVKALRQLAKNENDPKYLTSSIELFELGDHLIDQLRKEHQDQDTKLFWRKQAIPFYEDAIEVCYEMQDVEKAFFFFEKSKAVLLLEALQASNALDVLPDDLKNKIQLKQQKLLQIKENLENTIGDDQQDIIKELIGLQNEFSEDVKKLAKDYPKYLDVKFETQVIGLRSFQRDFSKNKNQTAVHFFYGEKNVYAIKVYPPYVKLIKLGKTQDLEKPIRNLLSFFEKSTNIENQPQDFLNQAHLVFTKLIAPLDIREEDELLVFPDGALAYLPFDALVKTPSNDIASADYVLRKHIIRYGYSATIFSKQNQKMIGQEDKGIAAFAPFSEKLHNSNYATLTFSQDELNEISQTFKGVFYKNKKATKQEFLNQAGKSSVLHLSTHAYSSATELRPHIVFADTSLFLSELYGLDISANLVVLSACQSNIGKLSAGEGVMSLGRGFTYAGAQSLISSLWNVNANSTGKILSNFYKKIQNKTSKNSALHAAKLAYLQDENIPTFERSPYYWAGMIYYGDDGGVVLEEKLSIPLFVKVLIFLLGIFGGIFLLKKWKIGEERSSISNS